MSCLRLFILLVFAFISAPLEAQNCASGIRLNTANIFSPSGGGKMLLFFRNEDLPFFTSTITTFAPYTASLPSIDGNQLLAGCFAANPTLVGPPANYQDGMGGQRAAVIHAADNTSAGMAMLFFSAETTLRVWKLNSDLSIGPWSLTASPAHSLPRPISITTASSTWRLPTLRRL